jgi:hypothetical protein
MPTFLLIFAIYARAVLTHAQSISTLPRPEQPIQTGAIGTFNIIGNSLVSAQQVSQLYLVLPFRC